MARNRKPQDERVFSPVSSSTLRASQPEELTRPTESVNLGLRGGAGPAEVCLGPFRRCAAPAAPSATHSAFRSGGVRPAPVATAFPARRHGRCGRGRRGEATAKRHETGQQGHRARHRQPAPGEAGRDAAAAPGGAWPLVGEGGRVKGSALPTRARAAAPGPRPETTGRAAKGHRALRGPRTAQLSLGLRFTCAMSRCE